MELTKTTDTASNGSPFSALFTMFYEPSRAFAMLEPKRHAWLPLVLLWSAPKPVAVLSTGYLLFKSASAPVAVLWSPVLKRSAPAPLAVFKFPAVLAESEDQPVAVLPRPVVRFFNALVPSAVVNPG